MSFKEKDNLTIFELFISDAMVKREIRKRGINFALPFMAFSSLQIYSSLLAFAYVKSMGFKHFVHNNYALFVIINSIYYFVICVSTL